MTRIELEKQFDQLDFDLNKAKRELIKKYCDANNPYKIGDKFTDHIGTILIESISYYWSTEPCCVYFGLELKKDGTPKNNRNKRKAWQSNALTTL